MEGREVNESEDDFQPVLGSVTTHGIGEDAANTHNPAVDLQRPPGRWSTS